MAFLCISGFRCGRNSFSFFVVSSSAYSHSDADVLNQSLLEANIATEVCLTVLDTLSIFIMGFKVAYITYHLSHSYCYLMITSSLINAS